MPNRIIKESICTSDSIDKLTSFHETFFYRLLVNCDDYGRLDARPTVLASKLFPLRRSIRDEQIIGALKALASAELVDLYEVAGKPFLQIVTWAEHQSIRAKKPKYPAKEGTCKQMHADEITCKQMHADVPVIQSNPIQSYSSAKDAFIDDDEAVSIAQSHAEVYDKAKACGFDTNTATIDRLTALIASHGVKSVLSALDECVEHNAHSLAYLRKVLSSKNEENTS